MDLSPLKHFNCKVMIINETDHAMQLKGTNNEHGDYDPAPPEEIPARSTINFELKHTDWSIYGTEGSCEYLAHGSNGKSHIRFSYSCPSGTGLNSTDAVITHKTDGDINVRMIPNPLPESGHPVNVQFTVY